MGKLRVLLVMLLLLLGTVTSAYADGDVFYGYLMTLDGFTTPTDVVAEFELLQEGKVISTAKADNSTYNGEGFVLAFEGVKPSIGDEYEIKLVSSKGVDKLEIDVDKTIGVGESQKVTIKEADFEKGLLLGASMFPLKLVTSEKSSGAYIKVYGAKMEPLSGVTVSVENSSSKKVSKLVTN